MYITSSSHIIILYRIHAYLVVVPPRPHILDSAYLQRDVKVLTDGKKWPVAENPFFGARGRNYVYINIIRTYRGIPDGVDGSRLSTAFAVMRSRRTYTYTLTHISCERERRSRVVYTALKPPPPRSRRQNMRTFSVKSHETGVYDIILLLLLYYYYCA